MAKKPTTPLEITIKLKDGRLISSDGVVMFDSILYHAWFYKHAPHVLRGESSETYDGNIGLPLRQLPFNRWAASRGIYTEISRNVEYYNKRPDFFVSDKIHHLAEKKGIIREGEGAYRAYRCPVIVRTIKDGIIKFYCLGHSEEIRDLLSRIPCVGKKISMGYGIIEAFDICEIDNDYSTYHPEYGLMRPIPVDDVPQGINTSGYPVMYYGIRPPYWKPTNSRPCFVPVGG